MSVSDFTRFLQRSDLPRHTELLVVDTYAAATPGASENSSEDTTTAMVHGQLWRDTLQTTVLFVHHTNASGSRERGHSAMRGAADFMLSLTPVDDVIHVECSKQRNGPPLEPFALKLVPVPGGTGCTLRLASDVIGTNDLTPMQAKALAILQDTFGADGATKSEWQRACQDIAERIFHRVAKVLVDRDHVRQVGTHFRVAGRES